MLTFVFLATAWGPKAGGINTFNMDMAKALAKALGSRCHAVCVIPKPPSPDTKADASKHGVTLVSLELDHDDSFDPGWAADTWHQLQQQGISSVDWWMGHDVISGEAAIRAKDQSGQGKTALIMHMSYLDYQGYKHDSSVAAQNKHNKQREIFEKADRVFAVGPLLRDRADDFVNEVTMLIPGLPENIPSVKPQRQRIRAISFGRLDPANDRIKQVSLAVAGFAAACKEARERAGGPPALKDNSSDLTLLGIADDKEERELTKLAQTHAGRVIPLHALPYEEEREKLLKHVAESNLALMLSWHEGFGLTGWEAIAAEVPLIVSEQSGLFQFLKSVGLGGQCHPLPIDGFIPATVGDPPFSDGDVERVANKILDISVELDTHRKTAQELKKSLLHKKCTWANTAYTFLEALGYKETQAPEQHPQVDAALELEGLARTSAQKAPEPILDDGEHELSPALAGVLSSALLRAEYRVVPFHKEREPVVDELITWTERPAPSVLLQLRTGSGGSGKTRMAIELCRRLREKGWEAGFLSEGTQPGKIQVLLGRSRQTLIVIDYAETRRRDIYEALRLALNVAIGNRVRILLLARAGGEWWEHLADGAKDQKVKETLGTPELSSGPYELPKLAIAEEQRADLFGKALQAFGPKLGKATQDVNNPALHAEHFADPLFIHLAALCALRGERPESARDLLDATLRHERDYWKRAMEDEAIPGTRIDGFEQVIALLTLMGGTESDKDTRALLKETPKLEGLGTDEREKIMALLRRLYARQGMPGIEGLHPDLLGERVVIQALKRDDSMLEIALNKKPEKALRTGYTVLTRAARHGEEERRWLGRALEGEYFVRNAKVVVEVAIEEGKPLPDIMEEVLQRAPALVQQRLVPALREYMPDETLALQGVALLVAERWLGIQLGKKTDAKAQGRRIELSEAHNNLANRLHDAGHWERAREEFEQALKLLQGLDDNDRMKAALSNLSLVLGDLGLHDEALQRAREAEARATKTIRSANPMIQVKAAAVLNNLANYLGALGRFEEALNYARQTEDIYHRAAEARPDAYRANWAISLNNLAIRLSDIGEYLEALPLARNAEEIYRELAAARPDAYRADWARSIANLAELLLDTRSGDEALNKAREATHIYSELAQKRPDVHRAYEGWSRRILAQALLSQADPKTARAEAEASIACFEQSPPKAEKTKDLAEAFHLLAQAHEALGDREAARNAADRAISILEADYQKRPKALERLWQNLLKTRERLA